MQLNLVFAIISQPHSPGERQAGAVSKVEIDAIGDFISVVDFALLVQFKVKQPLSSNRISINEISFPRNNSSIGNYHQLAFIKCPLNIIIRLLIC